MTFRYQPLFELGSDESPYRKLTGEHVGEARLSGKRVLVVEPEGLERLAAEAVRDVSHLFRTSHL